MWKEWQRSTPPAVHTDSSVSCCCHQDDFEPCLKMMFSMYHAWQALPSTFWKDVHCNECMIAIIFMNKVYMVATKKLPLWGWAHKHLLWGFAAHGRVLMIRQWPKVSVIIFINKLYMVATIKLPLWGWAVRGFASTWSRVLVSQPGSGQRPKGIWFVSHIFHVAQVKNPQPG